ncbi:MAG: hypothetical protein ACKOBL_10500, partial [Chloroflexota bacterium]
FTLLLFSLSLIYKWQTADNFSTIGGLFPVRDAYEYYQGSQMIIYGLNISGTSIQRPMFAAFLSTVMWIINGNLQLSLILLVILNAVATFWVSFEIKRTLNNSFFSAIYLVLGYIYFRRFSGTLLTENLGFLLGNLALFFLLRGATSQKLNFSLFGLFLLTIGLNARAGAFFVLPILIVWAAVTFRATHRFWRTFFVSSAIVVFGMAGNWLLAKAINSPTSAMFSNYSYTLYGLAVGNKGWEQVLVDHPGVSANEIYTLAFNKIKNEPALFIQGIAGAYSDYFVASRGAFSFLLLKRDRNDILNTILWTLSLLGLITAIIKREQKQYSLTLAFFAGIMLSVGLVPPIDSTNMRAFAATIPMSLYIVVTSGGLLSEFVFGKSNSLLDKVNNAHLPISLSSIILIAIFIVPVILREAGSPPSVETGGNCKSGENETTFVIADGSSMTINSEAQFTYIPTIQSTRFMNKLFSPEQLADGAAIQLMSELPPGSTLTIVRLVSTSHSKFHPKTSGILVTQSIPQLGIQAICVSEPVLGSYYFLPEGTFEAKTSSISAQFQKNAGLILKFGLWVIFLSVLIKSTRFWKLPSRIIPIAGVNTVLIAAGVLLLLHTTGVFPLVWERQEIDVEKARNPEGFMYVYNIGTDKYSDTKFWDAPAYLYENDVLLVQPHESQSLISEYGRGRYILREKVLFFSSSDNTNPKENQRQYTLEYPLEIRIRYQIIIFSLAILGLLIEFFYFSPILKTISKEAN